MIINNYHALRGYFEENPHPVVRCAAPLALYPPQHSIRSRNYKHRQQGFRHRAIARLGASPQHGTLAERLAERVAGLVFVATRAHQVLPPYVDRGARDLVRRGQAMLDAGLRAYREGMGADWARTVVVVVTEFGRTAAANGSAGTDHGWGSHHWIVGGAVRGQAFYGTPPPVSAGETGSEADQSHVGQGRLIPTTSVDQYAATLSSWLGVPDPFMNQVVPNINRFGAAAGRPDYPWNLGFMN